MTTATAAGVVSLAELEERRARAEEIDRRSEPGYYAEHFEDSTRCLDERLSSSVDAIVDRVARRPDNTLDLERLARLTVAAALQVDHHLGDHQVTPGGSGWREAPGAARGAVPGGGAAGRLDRRRLRRPFGQPSRQPLPRSHHHDLEGGDLP
jgi:hypothetical protein